MTRRLPAELADLLRSPGDRSIARTQVRTSAAPSALPLRALPSASATHSSIPCECCGTAATAPEVLFEEVLCAKCTSGACEACLLEDGATIDYDEGLRGFDGDVTPDDF